ncbi:MAG TPA: T9SS type A sorting domain-containing protein [Chryseolinea sp.]|nr:T9SS type A sorting domain-containing protein [Chryseolinea sp.]
MRNFTLVFLSVFALLTISTQSQAQCPRPAGMTAAVLNGGGTNCFVFVQFAIANSNVSVYNASGFVAQGSANAMGTAFIVFPCSSGPITGVLSVVLPAGTPSCTTVTISTPITLPVKLTSFTGKITAQGTELKWSTSYELNNSKYVVEKSADARNYTAVGEIAASESTLEVKNYSFTDGSFKATDIAYYRLKQVDIDGHFTYSKVIYVNDSKSAAGKISLFPNPFSNEIQITGISSADINSSNVRLYSAFGAQLKFELSGSNAIKVDASLPTGMYILKIKDKAYKIFKN